MMQSRRSWHGGTWVYPTVLLFCLAVVATAQAQSTDSQFSNFQSIPGLSDTQLGIARPAPTRFVTQRRDLEPL